MVVVDRGDRGAALVATQQRRRTTQRSAAQRSAGGPGHDDETPCRQTHTQHSSDEQCRAVFNRSAAKAWSQHIN